MWSMHCCLTTITSAMLRIETGRIGVTAKYPSVTGLVTRYTHPSQRGHSDHSLHQIASKIASRLLSTEAFYFGSECIFMGRGNKKDPEKRSELNRA